MDAFLNSWLLKLTFSILTSGDSKESAEPSKPLIISFSSTTPENYFETPISIGEGKWVDLSKLLIDDAFIKLTYDTEDDLLEAMVTQDEI